MVCFIGKGGLLPTWSRSFKVCFLGLILFWSGWLVVAALCNHVARPRRGMRCTPSWHAVHPIMACA